MSKMVTYTGRVVDLEKPSPDVVSVDDVAHSLSLQCRWVGQCRHFYSVAEHSVLVMLKAGQSAGSGVFDVQLTTRQRLAALLHDAHEAYVGDVTRPLKHCLEGRTTAFRTLDDSWKRTVAEKFGFLAELEDDVFQKTFVKNADDACLYAEALALFPDDHESLVPRIYDPVVQVECLLPAEAESLFLSTFRNLEQRVRLGL